MSTQDDEFMVKLRSTFKAEAHELLQSISSMLLELEKSPAAGPAAVIIEKVYREAHTLKGAARAVDLPGIEGICQQVEGVFSSWKRQQGVPSSEAFDQLHRAVDMMGALLPSGDGQPADTKTQQNELIQRLERLQSQPTALVRRIESAPVPVDPAAVAAASAPPVPNPPSSNAPPSNPPMRNAPASNASPEPERSTAVETVRVAIDKLDSRLLKAESMLVLKAIAAQRVHELRDTAARLDQWQREWSKVSSEARTLRQALEHDGKGAVAASVALVSFLNWNCEFVRSMEAKLHALHSQAQHDRHEVGKHVDDLLEDSKKLLMLPFSTLANQFSRLVRDLCRDQNKEAEFIVRGSEVEIDRRILEEMKEALIHILRNCVDHGVETPAQRQEANKPPRATIMVAASPVNGNKVEIMVSDDGVGVDLQRVKESAVRHGILTQHDADLLGEADAMHLIFHSEVSTSPIVTRISGRGLGMAIVQTKTEKLGGRISIESKPKMGTTLRMLLPLTLATFRGDLVSISDRLFIVPVAHVERVLRVRPQDIQTVENREVILVQGKAVSLARLHSILEIQPGPGDGGVSELLQIVIVHSADQRLALVVDQVLHEEEVLVKPLHKPLVRVRNIAGATVLGSGRVVPVLNVSDVIRSARVAGTVAVPTVAVSTVTSKELREMPSKKVLVVEDSITSRMLLKGILETAGYQVQTAVDGVDAFTALREGQYDLVVSDVEMPRMNGFDLTTRIRSDKRLGELPVVLITALESREQRERGIDAGANAYVVKSSFDQQNLLEVIRRLA